MRKDIVKQIIKKYEQSNDTSMMFTFKFRYYNISIEIKKDMELNVTEVILYVYYNFQKKKIFSKVIEINATEDVLENAIEDAFAFAEKELYNKKMDISFNDRIDNTIFDMIYAISRQAFQLEGNKVDIADIAYGRGLLPKIRELVLSELNDYPLYYPYVDENY